MYSGVARIFSGEVLFTNKRNFFCGRVLNIGVAYNELNECDRISHVPSVLAYSLVKLDILTSFIEEKC